MLSSVYHLQTSGRVSGIHEILESHPLAVNAFSSLGPCSQALILLVVKIQVSQSIQDRRHQGIICLLGAGADSSILVARLALAVNDGFPQRKEKLPCFFTTLTWAFSTCRAQVWDQCRSCASACIAKKNSCVQNRHTCWQMQTKHS